MKSHPPFAGARLQKSTEATSTMNAEPEDTDASDDSAPSEDAKSAAMKRQKAEDKDAILPAPVPEKQRKIAEEWQRPPGQSSG